MGHMEKQPWNPSRLAPTTTPAPRPPTTPAARHPGTPRKAAPVFGPRAPPVSSPRDRADPATAPTSSRPPMIPAARRDGTPRKAAQGTLCAACVFGSGNNACCQCKKGSRSQMHQGNETTSTTKGTVEQDCQYNRMMARFTGGTYSKPEPKTKSRPAEEVTYSPHQKTYGRSRTVGSTGSQKRHCRRSVTPPPSSRRVSLVESRSLTQNPKQVGAPHPSDNPLVTKAGPSKSGCTPESGKLCSRDINLTTSTIVPVLQTPIVEPALLSPTSVLSERPVEVYPDTRIAASVTQEPSVKSVLLTTIPVYRESSTECEKVPPKHNPQSIASAQHGALSQERNSEASISHGRSSGAPLILHTKLPKKHYQSEACWKGHFHVSGELIHTCDGLEAHFPLQISARVYEASKRMPEILNLEAIPVSQLWPKKFKMLPPSSVDIGLWFVSSHQSFDNLLEKVGLYGLFTNIGDTELAVFSSKLLTSQDQRKNGKLYFWGVFGKHIRKKPYQPNSRKKIVEISNPSKPNDSCKKYEEVGMKLDVTKGKEKEIAKSDIGMTLCANGGNPTDVTGNRDTVRDNYEGIAKALDFTGGGDTDKVNDCMAVLGTPDSNPASSCSVPAALLNGCCHHESAKNSTSILEDSACQPACRSLASPDLMLEIPPGFSPVPKARSQLQTGTATLSSVDVTPSLILDIPPGFPTDIPPGFTEAHRRRPPAISPAGPACASTPGAGTEKNPLGIPPGFPTDIPPGFTEAHRSLPPAISPAGPACVLTPIRFSLNVPRRHVKMGVPPGFIPLHVVKKEPGLPAVNETTDQGTLNSLASAVVKPGKGDETKIQDNEVKVEQDDSEEREIPKIRRLSDLYRRPSDSNEISRPMSAHLPDKFQEQTSEKQMHLRTRGCQASPEPSAETAIRKSNVNGRIALNKDAGHRNDEVRCFCASIEGRAAMATKGPLAASPGGDNESISCRCVVCGEEFPAQ